MKPALWGFFFGLLIPIFGLFVGLQFSALLANLMLFPLVVLSDLTGIVFGKASSLERILFVLISGVFWALLFFAVSRLSKFRRRK